MMRTFGFALALFLIPFTASASTSLVVKTDKGKVQGAFTADKQVRAFKGIPYAAPPLGDLRWQPPQPAAKWRGVRDTTQFGARCMQSNIYKDMIFHDPGPSEDCLTLNVWTPAKAKKGSLPVMVWIYGGGLNAGGTSESRQDGQFLAHRNVVIVSMNYRLGIFGFFAHPGLTAESPHHASGNYGLLDQNAALEWAQKNIAAFGGNPNNVTIFGESAGSESVSMLMASPLSKSRFQKAIGESGAKFPAGRVDVDSQEAAEQKGLKFAQAAFGTSSVTALRKMSAADLLKAAAAGTSGTHVHFGADVDGWFLPDSVPNIYAAGKQAHIPLLAGWNADEVSSAAAFAPLTAEQFRLKAEDLFGPNAADFLERYPASTDAEAIRSASDLASDNFIVYSTWRWLETQVATGGEPVYRYRLDLVPPADKFHPAGSGTFHSDDIEYVFGTLDSRQQATWRPEDRKLSDQIQQYWTNFARTGDPNGSDLPKWPAYNANDGWQVMHLDATSEARPDTQRDRYLFLDKVWSKPQTN